MNVDDIDDSNSLNKININIKGEVAIKPSGNKILKNNG